MKQRIVTSLVLLFSVLTAFPQAKVPPSDKSPMDMAYYPVNFPILKIQDKLTEPLIARVTYSRPQKAGRNVFGELVEYGKVWRFGANEATEIEFFSDVTVAGKPIPKGRYSIYAIPTVEKWVIIFNTETDTWGSFKYDQKKDIARIEIPVQKPAEPVESFSMTFIKSEDGFDMYAAWENAAVLVPMKAVGKQPSRTPVKKKSA